MGKSAFGNIDLWVAAWFAYYVCNTLAVSQTPCGSVFLHTVAWVAFYMLLRCVPLARIKRRVWAYICAALGCMQVLVGLSQLLGYSASNHHLYAMTGSFPNPAPWGAFIAIMLAVVTAVYKDVKDKKLEVVGLFLLVMLPAAWSRAALLAYGICMVILFRTYIKKYWKIVAICVPVIIVSLYFIKQGSADSRVLMSFVSLKAWMNDFWFGVGTGGYLHALGEGQAAYFTVHPGSAFIRSVGAADLPFNEPLRFAVEQGFVGLALLSGIMFLAARRLWTAAHPMFYALVALLVFSLFSYPFTIPTFGIILAIIVATAANIGQDNITWRRVAIPLIGSVALGATAYLLLLPRIEAKDEYDRFAGINDKAFIKDYYELLPYMNDSDKFLFNFGMLLRDAKRYNDSNAMLRQGAALSADPMFRVVMGRNYEDIHEYDFADSLYTYAFRMVPNRIYPLYRQMKLYEKAGDSARMKNKAKEVSEFTVKVESSVTRDLKKEATEILMQ